MFILTNEDGNVIVDREAQQAIARIHAGWQGWSLSIAEDGTPMLGGKVGINSGEAVASVMKFELLDQNGESLGEAQVKQPV